MMSNGWVAPGSQVPSSSTGDTQETPIAPDPSLEASTAGPQPTAAPARELQVRRPLFPLRPLGIGEILGAALGIYRARPRQVLALAAVVYGIAFIVLTLLAGVSMVPSFGQMAAEIENPMAGSAAPTGLEIVTDLITSALTSGIIAVASAIITVGLTTISLRIAVGEDPTQQEVRATIRSRAFPAILTSVITAFLAGLCLAIPIALSVLPLVFSLGPVWLGVLSIIGGVALGLILSLYLAVRFSLAIPALTIEGLSTLQAIKRSFSLTRGLRVFRILGEYLLLALIAYIATQILSGGFVMIGMVLYIGALLIGGSTMIMVGMGILLIVTMFGGYVATVLITPYMCAGLTAVYADTRMRHEAWDIELIQRARAAQGQAAA